MKHIIRFFTLSTLLISCHQQTISLADYPKELIIRWEELLLQQEQNYFGYVFSYHCPYCEKIKMIIFEYILYGECLLYLIEFDSSIPRESEKNNFYSTNNIFDLTIVGTPTLFVVENKEAKNRITGATDIKNFIAE